MVLDVNRKKVEPTKDGKKCPFCGNDEWYKFSQHERSCTKCGANFFW